MCEKIWNTFYEITVLEQQCCTLDQLRDIFLFIRKSLQDNIKLFKKKYLYVQKQRIQCPLTYFRIHLRPSGLWKMAACLEGRESGQDVKDVDRKQRSSFLGPQTR